jgi:hypothetical protein
LSKITDVPIALFVGKNDELATPAVGEWTKSHLKKVVHYQLIDNHNHDSFQAAKDMSWFQDVLNLITKFN